MHRQLHTGKLFLFSLGDFSRAVLGGLLVTYIIKFFNITESSGLPLLLPPALIGTLRGLSIVFDAVIDPWIASASDKSKNQRGRRIPFMRWAAIPYALTSLLIFFPPNRAAPSALNIVWVMGMLLACCVTQSLYQIPYQALQTEVVTDTRRRVFFYSIQSFNFVIGSAIIYVLPVMVSAFRSNGLSALAAWQVSFGIFACIGCAALILPAFLIRERDYVEPQESYLPLFKSFTATLGYKPFRILIAAYLAMQSAFVFFNTAMLFYIDILLGLKESFATIVLGLSIVIGISTYPLVNYIARRYGKRPPILAACAVYTVLYAGIYFYEPVSRFFGTAPVTNAFLVSLAGPAAVGEVCCGFLIGILIAFPIACTNILPTAAFADIAQYDAIVSGENKVGMFVAVRQFLLQFTQAVVTAVVAYVMYIGAADRKYPAVFGVRLTALIACAVVFAALLLYSRYDDRRIVSTIDEWNKKEAL
jgi:GPH family glycoside/pentoside/hexuronide:cation symporter